MPDSFRSHLHSVEIGSDPATAAKSSGDGGGSNIEGRLSALETRIEYLATKEDVQKLKVWVLGGVLASIPIAITITFVVAKLFSLFSK